jgi:two-component system phosphate regulon sensor histidine kinase PhoR
VAELERLQGVLRGLAAGAEPVRLLHETLSGAVAALGGRQGLLVGVADGVPIDVASTGAIPAAVREAAEAAVDQHRIARRQDSATGLQSVAAPIKIGTRVVGAIAVGGDLGTVDPTVLGLFVDAAGLVLAHKPPASTASVPEFLDALARLASELDRSTILVRIFDAADRLFGAKAGFCALYESEGARIAHFRGIDRERLRDATHVPEFKDLVTAPVLKVEPPTHPVVARLTDGAESAVSLPLIASGGRIGHVVLLLGEAPDAARRSLLNAFAGHIALTLRSAELQRRVHDRDEQLAAVVHSMPDPAVVVDETGSFLMVNGPAGELFHVSGTFEVGQPVAGQLGQPLLEAMLTGDDHRDGQVEVAIGHPPHVYRATVRRMHSSDGRSLGRIMVLDDITSEREAAQIKADLVAVIGHELRTPLTIMKGYVRTLLRKGDAIDERARTMALTALDSNAERLERLIEDLLLMSAIETARPHLELETVDVGEVVGERVAERVQIRRPRRELPVMVDRPKLEQILSHLIDNALKYSEGAVVVEVTDRDEEVEVSVTDSGPGIFSGDIPLLFERFQQLDGSSTRAHGGTGIGLYICRRLVEVLGGRIWCESRLGVGSRFAFTIPKDQPAEEPLPLDEIDEIDEITPVI